MSIVLNPEQTMLRDLVSRYFTKNYDFDTRRAMVLGGGQWRPEIWKELAELGLLGAAVPEALGGLGGGAVEHMIVMEQVGAHLALEPYIETTVIGSKLLDFLQKDVAALIGSGIIAGEVRLAFAQSEPRGRYNLSVVETKAAHVSNHYLINGFKSVVVSAAHATHLIVAARTGGGARDSDGISLFLVDSAATGISRRDFLLIDGHSASDVSFENVRVEASARIGAEGSALPILEELYDAAITASCAEAVGVLQRLLDDTVAYSKERKQFGQSIGSLQVLKHRMVDMFIEVQEAISMTHLATIAQEWPAAERSLAVAAAKVRVGNACRFVSQNAVQLHGGIGTAEELAVSHYFKRATILENLFGSVDHHLMRFASMSSTKRKMPMELS